MVNNLIDELMSPVSADNPCGEDLSFSPEFDRIHEARREDDPTLDYGEWVSALKQADWKSVVVECETLLKKKTKDMRVAAWLAEGLVKTSGLAGFCTGLEVHVGLLRHYGADVHPRSDDGDDERRIGTMSWFFQRMAYLVRCIPLTDSAAGRFSLADYDCAVSLQLQLQRHPESVPDLEGKVTLEKFSSAVSTTDARHFSIQSGVIDRCSGLVNELSNQIDDVLGDGAPSINPLRESVEALRLRIHSICKGLGLSSENHETENTSLLDGVPNQVALSAPASIGSTVRDPTPVRQSQNGIASRADAVEALRQVAAYFRQAEPHSPVAYLAEKALHWSEMPLHLWLRHVVKDPGVLSHLEDMLGSEDRKLASSD